MSNLFWIGIHIKYIQKCINLTSVKATTFIILKRLIYYRYGVWLLVGLCMPHTDEAALETTGLVSMLFEWYKVNNKQGLLKKSFIV